MKTQIMFINMFQISFIQVVTSKNLRKDADGVNKLTRDDIHAIENGLANYIFLDEIGIKPRIYEIMWELDAFRNGKDPGGHSVAQRMVYLKVAFNIISQNPVFGVGTGDVKMKFDSYYRNSKVISDQRWWYRAHNQYITFLISFGAIGLLIILFSFFLPVFLEKKWGDYLFLCFALIGFLSMLTEDTLETQTGVSLFMFFYSLFLFGRMKSENRDI